LGGREDVLGSSLLVNGQPLEVVGVAPAGFAGTTLGERADVFVPISLRWVLEPQAGDDSGNRLSHWVYLFARLAPGVTAEEAATAINLTHRQLVEELELPAQTSTDPEWLARFRAKELVLSDGSRGQSTVSGQAATPLALLLAAAGL